MEDGIIYTFGDVDALVVIFDGLRLLFDPDTTTFFSGTGGLGLGVATTLAAMIALIGTMNQYVSQQRMQIQGPLMGLFIYAVVAIPTVDRMYISDVNTGKTLPVYDVPIGLGVLGYGMSLISYQTSELMETAFQTVAIEGTAFESTMTGGSGFLSPVKTLYALRSSSLQELDEHLVYNMYSYAKYCLHVATEDRLATDPTLAHFEIDVFKRIASPFDYFTNNGHIDPGYTGNLAEFMDPSTGEESFQTCADIRAVLIADETSPGSMEYYLESSSKFGASRLRSLVTNNENAMQICADGGACIDSAAAITNSYESASQLLGGVGNARNFFRLRVMRDFNYLVSSSKEVDPDSAMMAISNINESIQTTQLQEALEAETFINFMLPAMNFIIMLFYALFPLAMLIMITKGMEAASYLAGYLLIGIWGYSIIPVATAINYITIANTREAISALLTMDGFTPFGYEMMVDTASNYLSVGSNMLAAAPIVTLAVITGSVFALTSVASGAAAPSGGAAAVARQSSPQANSQITQLGLSPHMTDVQGNPNLGPVSKRASDVAEAFNVSAAYSNQAVAKGVTADTKSASRDLETALSNTTSHMSDMIKRSSSAGFSGSEKAVVDGYQKIGQQFLREQNATLTGYSKDEARAIESAIGYINTVTASLGGMASLGSKNIASLVEKITGISLTEENVSNSQGALKSGQIDPSSPPGTADNPTKSVSPGKHGSNAGVGLNGIFSLEGGLARVGSDREMDTTSSRNTHSGDSSVVTGHEGQVTTSNGTSTSNSNGVRLTQEELDAVTQHQAQVRQETADFKNALERQQRYEDSAEKATQFAQSHSYTLNDVNARNGYRSVQAVKDHLDSIIDNGLEGSGFTKEQIQGIKDTYHDIARQTMNDKVPGANDPLSYLIGGAFGADEAAFQYGKIATDPTNGSNTTKLTSEQAKVAQNVLSNIDSKLFEPLMGSAALKEMRQIDTRMSEQQTRTAEAGGVESEVNAQTGHLDPANMGPGAPTSSLSRINQFTESLASQKGGGAISAAVSRYFQEEPLQNTIDKNAEALGVQQGTPFSELGEQQQNQVLAEQMNTALKEVPGALGIDTAGHTGAMNHNYDRGGIGQTDNNANLGAISGGSTIFKNMASGFDDTVESRKGDIKQEEAFYEQVDKDLTSANTSKYAFGAGSELLGTMSRYVPGSAAEDSVSDSFIGAGSHSPLAERQAAWNTSLRSALGNEVSANRIDEAEANLIYNAHHIDTKEGSTTTPTEAYAGLVAGNVAGNYDTNKGAFDSIMSDVGHWFGGTDEVARGSTVERMKTSYEGATSPMDSLHSQRENLKMSPSENFEYLKSVRDGVAANHGDISNFSDEKLKSVANGQHGSWGFMSGMVNNNSSVNNVVEDMLSTLPDQISGRSAANIIQAPLFDIQSQRTTPSIPPVNGPNTANIQPLGSNSSNVKITDGLDNFFSRPSYKQ